jgi:HSP20 family molecular chaperone IbpA
MKKLARAAFLLAMTGMLAGCSSASKTVTTTCSGDIVDGLPTSITVSAPSADDEISEMIMNITMTADFFGLEGDLDTDTIKNSGLDSLLASMLGVEESDLQVTYGKDSVEVKITAQPGFFRSPHLFRCSKRSGNQYRTQLRLTAFRAPSACADGFSLHCFHLLKFEKRNVNM